MSQAAGYYSVLESLWYCVARAKATNKTNPFPNIRMTKWCCCYLVPRVLVNLLSIAGNPPDWQWRVTCNPIIGYYCKRGLLTDELESCIMTMMSWLLFTQCLWNVSLITSNTQLWPVTVCQHPNNCLCVCVCLCKPHVCGTSVLMRFENVELVFWEADSLPEAFRKNKKGSIYLTPYRVRQRPDTQTHSHTHTLNVPAVIFLLSDETGQS